jgi:hypothetical protein
LKAGVLLTQPTHQILVLLLPKFLAEKSFLRLKVFQEFFFGKKVSKLKDRKLAQVLENFEIVHKQKHSFVLEFF